MLYIFQFEIWYGERPAVSASYPGPEELTHGAHGIFQARGPLRNVYF